MEPEVQLRTVAGSKRPIGRPIKRGKFVYDERSGVVGYFVDYCGHCNHKLILTRGDIRELFGNLKLEKKTRSFKVLDWLLRSRLL